MTKRVLNVFLCVALLLSMVLCVPIQARAASNLKCTEDGITTLKQMEGFSKFPYMDGGQYTVGYGSACPAAELEKYRAQGITENEADELLREYVEAMETKLNSFADRQGITLSQQEFDALLLFTYNVGAGWMNEASDLRTAIIGRKTGNDFIYCFTRWCTSEGQINEGLIKRRLAEADLYLNGRYGTAMPAYYSYVLLDANAGSCVSGVQGYDASETAAVKVNATREGYKFLGWYTEKEGGRRITDLDTTTAAKTLYARWQGSASQGEPANYQRVVTRATDIYKMDGTGSVVGQLAAGQTVTITMDYIDGNGLHWGQTAQGWINVADTHQSLSKAQKPAGNGVSVKVTNAYINVRSGPGTSYNKVGTVYLGDQLLITETRTVNNALWGKFAGGWISLQYTDYQASNAPSGSNPGTGNTDTVIATGTVVNCTVLRVRSGPGTGYAQVGSIAAGTYVEITEKKTGTGMEWGKIHNGWISLSYVLLEEPNRPSQPTTPSDPSDPTEPSEPGTGNENPGTDSETKTGTVVNCTVLNVRSGPGTHNALVTTLPRGTKVEVLETTVHQNQPWARIQQGWVAMHYIQLDYNSSGMGSSAGVTGTVYNCTRLNVRRAPGTNNTPVGVLYPGNTVTIYEETTVSGMHWGRTDQGWVCMDYIRLNNSGPAAGGVPETPTEGTRTGVVIRTNALRVRTGPGTRYAQVATLNMGTIVIIYEQAPGNGSDWGRTDKGWVCMDYIQLDPPNGHFLGTVFTNGLTIHTTAGAANTVVGSYEYGDMVTILETTSVNGVAWGRTDKGWICLQHVYR